jgi:glyoxylase-like metal-dependent hydrolase (beta-lactamase superfamily II)
MKERSFGPVRWIPGTNGGKYPFCHSIYVEGAGVLIDPASDRDRLKRLRQEEDVREVWLSHWHEDHIMHLDLFDDLPLRISEADAPPLAGLEAFLDAYGMPEGDEREHWRKLMLEQFHFRPRRPRGILEGGDRVDLGTVTVELIPTPGHTPGHMAFFFVEPRVLFLGDYDLTSFGPWYGDRDSRIPDVITSVEALRKVPAKVWIAGHGRGLFEEDPKGLWDRYLEVVHTRERKLLELLAQRPRTMEEIIEAWIVYGRPREPKAFFAFGERAIMGKHLEDLMERGRVVREGNRFVLL